MALKGVNVLELAGLAPVPFCGMILSDFGANVIRVEKTTPEWNLDTLNHGKKSISLNLKHPKGVFLLRALIKRSDVLIEPFRRGVMERLGLGPDILLNDNPGLIYARLTGYGQSGPLADRAGHDINYLAISGLLSMFRRFGEKPLPPVNVLADFGGGGLMCALGILLALLEKNKSGLGQVIDSNMVGGSVYLGSFLIRNKKLPLFEKEPGLNFLDSGAHFYQVYQTKDAKFIAVGAIEPQFYQELLKGLDMTEEEAPQFGDFNKLKVVFAKKFLEKTREEWCEIFDSTDACVSPVLDLDEATKYPHNTAQKYFLKTEEGVFPQPAPVLSRTSGKTSVTRKIAKTGEHTREILSQLGFSDNSIKELEDDGIIKCHHQESKL